VSHQKVTDKFPTAPVVYFVRIARRAIKIGFTTDLRRRCADLQCTSPDDISVLTVFPGGKDLERKLHRLFAHLRIRNELFRDDGLIWDFIQAVEYKSLAFAIEYLEEQKRWREMSRTEQNAILFKRRADEREKSEVQYQKIVAQRIKERDSRRRPFNIERTIERAVADVKSATEEAGLIVRKIEAFKDGHVLASINYSNPEAAL
jgi:hypothetical protein